MKTTNRGPGLTSLREQLRLRARELESILEIIEETKKQEPPGRLRLNANHGTMQYFQVINPNDNRGHYIKKSDIQLIKSLAQKGYNSKLEESVRAELQALYNLLIIQDNSPEAIYDTLQINRKELVNPYILDDATFAAMWRREEFIASDFKPEEKTHETNKGEMVRSKTEMAIANIYYELGIPYRYECKLDLRNGYHKFPDFTLLDVKRRRVVYHEHLGRMDKETYRIDNIKKISLYRESGIYTGKNLLLTFEIDECPLNIPRFKKSIQEIFCV